MSEQLALFEARKFDQADVSVSVHCLECGANTGKIGEFYIVRAEVWLLANPAGDGMLCIGCLEQRLGRSLTRLDFTEAPCNHDEMPRSLRLLRRLGRLPVS